MKPSINIDRLSARLFELGKIGAHPGGGATRIALTPEDKAGRDLVMRWMRDLDMEISIDRIGNVFGVWGRGDKRPIMTGSHIDTVGSGGLYDGNLGVLAGLEVVETLQEQGVTSNPPLCVAVFTNEEGVRFQPDMMGSLVAAGGLPVDAALAVKDREGISVADALKAIGYDGPQQPGHIRPQKFIELHIEQGPVLEAAGKDIGVVECVQGIHWQTVVIKGTANHAGTTPLALRRDAGYAAARLATFVREMARDMGGNQLATVGRMEFSPNLINVIPKEAAMTIDLRNTDGAALKRAVAMVEDFKTTLEKQEQVEISSEVTVDLAPVNFDDALASRVETAAKTRGLSFQRMPSGAGHDAQMMARLAPTAMIFIPSKDGISHNVREYSSPDQIEAGANVLLDVVLGLLES